MSNVNKIVKLEKQLKIKNTFLLEPFVTLWTGTPRDNTFFVRNKLLDTFSFKRSRIIQSRWFVDYCFIFSCPSLVDTPSFKSESVDQFVTYISTFCLTREKLAHAQLDD